MLTRIIMVLSVFLLLSVSGHATNPIKEKPFYIEANFQYPFYKYYNQFAFSSKGFSPGIAVDLGKHRFPIYLEYTYNTPIQYEYRNHRISNVFQEIGLRYSLNSLSYIIPYGVDPYVGLGLAALKTTHEKFALVENGNGEVVLNGQFQSVNYKLSAGVKIGNKNVTLGIHYDYLPSKILISGGDSDGLPIYNTQHLVSARIGYRISMQNQNGIKCPRFNTKIKRTLPF